MAVSVIVSNFNGERYLPRLLETLHAQEGVKLEIIVVDRHSTDESANILAQHPEVRVLDEAPESGLVAGYAVGVPHAQHESLFFCNEDMWFSPDCLQLLEAELLACHQVGAAMPVQLTYDGTDVVNAGHWFQPALWHGSNINPFWAAGRKHLNGPETLSGINAGACLVSRKAYDQLGGWDVSFFLDFEDIDLSIRLWQRGWLCRIVPTAIAYHAVGASNKNSIKGRHSAVGRKRYISALSNEMVVGLKTFSGPNVLAIPLLIWLDRVFRDLLRGRLERFWLVWTAGILTLKRLPKIAEYRRNNHHWNKARPGQTWCQDSRFAL